MSNRRSEMIALCAEIETMLIKNKLKGHEALRILLTSIAVVMEQIYDHDGEKIGDQCIDYCVTGLRSFHRYGRINDNVRV